jgi:SIR2-like protein
MTVVGFAKKMEESTTNCEVIKFSTEYCLDEAIAATESSSLRAEQLLELVIEVKADSPSSLSALEIFLEKDVSYKENITSSYLKQGLVNEGKYTGEFQIKDVEKRLITIDGIRDVQIPEESATQIELTQLQDVKKVIVQFPKPIQSGNRVALRLLLDVSNFATYKPSSPSIDFMIKIFSAEGKTLEAVRHLDAESKNLLIPARKILDMQTKIGGFDILLILPTGYTLDYAIPNFIGPLSTYRPNCDQSRIKGLSIFLWRARLIFPSEEPSLGTVKFGDSIRIKGRASKMTSEGAEYYSPSLIQPKNVFDYPSPQLLEDVKNGHAVFFIGSAFLEPPRYKHIDEILSYVEKVEEMNKLLKKPYYSTQIASVNYLPYSELKAFIEEVWKAPTESHNLLAKLQGTNIMVTTIFDSSIEKAMQNNDKEIIVVTGSESITKNFPINFGSVNLFLYKLLGDIDNPKTLCLTDRMMQNLRNSFKKSETAVALLQQIIEDKTLVLLGYDGRDTYDNFFRALVNDISYKFNKSLTKDIYLVGQLEFDNPYGIWEKRNQNDISVITLSPVDFLRIFARGNDNA